jgi:hypothetical protein
LRRASPAYDPLFAKPKQHEDMKLGKATASTRTATGCRDHLLAYHHGTRATFVQSAHQKLPKADEYLIDAGPPDRALIKADNPKS